MRVLTLIDIPVYSHQLLVAVGTSPQFICDYLQKNLLPQYRHLLPALKEQLTEKIDDPWTRANYIQNPKVPGFGMVYIPDGKTPKTTLLGLLVHELTHATLRLGEQLGFTHCYESEEFYTYMNQYLFENAYSALWPEKKKNNLTT